MEGGIWWRNSSTRSGMTYIFHTFQYWSANMVFRVMINACPRGIIIMSRGGAECHGIQGHVAREWRVYVVMIILNIIVGREGPLAKSVLPPNKMNKTSFPEISRRPGMVGYLHTPGDKLNDGSMQKWTPVCTFTTSTLRGSLRLIDY